MLPTRCWAGFFTYYGICYAISYSLNQITIEIINIEHGKHPPFCSGRVLRLQLDYSKESKLKFFVIRRKISRINSSSTAIRVLQTLQFGVPTPTQRLFYNDTHQRSNRSESTIKKFYSSLQFIQMVPCRKTNLSRHSHRTQTLRRLTANQTEGQERATANERNR
uniref:Uncharacterized protein n=1 Tax=Onchocerca volvulus TaxID=6282 RepID=A0A8R1TML1_ONCVO